MSIYFPHVGERGGRRDFPKTIGDREGGLKRFSLLEIESHLTELSRRELAELRVAIETEATDGFQIWGIPSGARSILRSLAFDDWLLLLESDRPGGAFHYAGRVIYCPERELFRLSNHLWGEERFPIVLFLVGNLINLGWETFRDDFDFAPNWRLAGNTYPLKEERIASSRFGTEMAFVAAVLSTSSSEGDGPDSLVLDQVELLLGSMEGREVLRRHVLRERDSSLISRFKASLSNFRCEVCDFDFEVAYGAIGRAFIEAHHVEPIGLREGESPTRLVDFAAVCSNCHRMLHRPSPSYTVDEMKGIVLQRDGSY
jgi:hypothetical protein